ncbi:tetratricopeptide repeat protein [Candidatus Thalassolituus haligoni]|uniref:tetratricopeptide repeat protein n=1 Tax=Candidatus Thalassolituus haligoni TaxID=3100113 RepID=UPI003511B9FC|tara:strand:- start:4482 stop:5867 length:1386 start_codon:yes stop_codon:yes gene_type:complete
MHHHIDPYRRDSYSRIPVLLLAALAPLQLNPCRAASVGDAAPAVVTEAATLETLIASIRSGDFSSAYQIAHTLLAMYEGEEAFDLMYGSAALETRNLNEAWFVFDRLHSRFPQNLNYHFELARCQYAMGQMLAAETGFQTVLAADPLPAIATASRNYLQQISQQQSRSRRSWSVALATAAGYDTNINTATSEREIDLFDGQLSAILSEEQRAIHSGYFRYSAAVQMSLPLTSKRRVYSSVSFARKDNNGNDTYDLDAVQFRAGAQQLLGQHQLNASLGYEYYWLGHDSLQSMLQLTTEWRWNGWQHWQPQFELHVISKDSQLNDEADTLQIGSRTALAYQQGLWSSMAGVSWSSDLDDQAELARDTAGADARLSYQLNSRLALHLQGLYRQYDYQHGNDLLAPGKDRQEHLGQASIGWQYQLLHWLTLHNQFSYLRNASSISVYQYDRALFEAGLTVSFQN